MHSSFSRQRHTTPARQKVASGGLRGYNGSTFFEKRCGTRETAPCSGETRWGAALSQTEKPPPGPPPTGPSQVVGAPKPVSAAPGKPGTVVYTYADGSTFVAKGNHPDRDNNPGNVIAGKFATEHGAIGSDKGFAIFPSATEGWTAMHDTITGTYGSLSVNDMIAKYAPPNENNTAGYQATATSLAGVSGTAVISTLSTKQVAVLMNVMASKVEGWHGDPYVPSP